MIAPLTQPVDPGNDALFDVRVKNNGTIVENVQLAVRGLPSDWTITIEAPSADGLGPSGLPPELRLDADPKGTARVKTEGRARVRVHPPRQCTTVPGVRSFEVVAAASDPSVKSVATAKVDVGSFESWDMQVVPDKSEGMQSGLHTVNVGNSGSVPLNGQLQGADQTGKLRIRFGIEMVEIAPGQHVSVGVRVAAPRPVWTGQPKHHPFDVKLQPRHGDATKQSAVYEQLPIFSKWAARAIAAVAVLLVVALGVFAWERIRAYQENQPSDLANVVGLPVGEARSQLQDAGFKSIEQEFRDDESDKETVIAQDPEGGQKVNKSTPVRLILSNGPQLFTVSDMTGRELAEAKELLGLDGFSSFQEKHKNDPGAAGIVIAQHPPPGREIPADSTITLTVSDGPVLIALEGLNLKRQTVITAKQLLIQNKLVVGEVTETPTIAQPPGTVVDFFAHAPQVDGQVPEGTEVDLVSAIAARLKPVPSLDGKSASEAFDLLADEEFVAQVSLVESEWSAVGRVQEYSPREARAGETIDIKVGAGKQIPDIIGLTQEEAEAALSNRGWTPQRYELPGCGEPPGRVSSQDKPAGALAFTAEQVIQDPGVASNPDTTVTFQVSEKQSCRPGVVILEADQSPAVLQANSSSTPSTSP